MVSLFRFLYSSLTSDPIQLYVPLIADLDKIASSSQHQSPPCKSKAFWDASQFLRSFAQQVHHTSTEIDWCHQQEVAGPGMTLP